MPRLPAEQGTFASTAKRQADIYVFAIHAHLDPATLDPLNLDQWQFYVVRTADLNLRLKESRSISLRALKSLCPEPIPFSQLGITITHAALRLPPDSGDCIEIDEHGIHRIHRSPSIYDCP